MQLVHVVDMIVSTKSPAAPQSAGIEFNAKYVVTAAHRFVCIQQIGHSPLLTMSRDIFAEKITVGVVGITALKGIE